MVVLLPTSADVMVESSLQCGITIHKCIANELAPFVRYMSFFTAEFVVRAHYKGYRILEVPVPHYARKIGSTSIFYVSKLFMICLHQFVGLFRLRKELISSGKNAY